MNLGSIDIIESISLKLDDIDYISTLKTIYLKNTGLNTKLVLDKAIDLELPISVTMACLTLSWLYTIL